MAEPATEQCNKMSKGLDALDSTKILSILLESQVAAARTVENSIPDIEKAARLLADTLNNSGNIIFAAAGSSGFMTLADGLELPGTFGILNNRIVILIAGNSGNLSDLTGYSEDDSAQAFLDIQEANVSAKDCLICVSASGTTPYAVDALKAAGNVGAAIIGIANNPNTPILDGADVAICLKTLPEIIPGSTRLGAATAQKIALNMMSTLMGIHLGHVHDGYMVNVRADNAKLIKRACSIISNLSGCTATQAQKYLETSEGSVKLAIMLASGAQNIVRAKEILESNGHKLRPSLSVLKDH